MGRRVHRSTAGATFKRECVRDFQRPRGSQRRIDQAPALLDIFLLILQAVVSSRPKKGNLNLIPFHSLLGLEIIIWF